MDHDKEMPEEFKRSPRVLFKFISIFCRVLLRMLVKVLLLLVGILECAMGACYDDRVCEARPYLKCCDDYLKCGVTNNQRIYGCSPVQAGDLPWMAVLYYQNQKHKEPYCGASIISQRFLLTAAHCVTGEIVQIIGQP